jgi:hypothetical protein
VNRGAPEARNSLYSRAAQLKVVVPLMLPRMEKLYDLCRKRVNTGKIRAFAQVATVASQSQICRLVISAVLFGDYVFHMMSEVAVLLSKKAILAAITGAAPD